MFLASSDVGLEGNFAVEQVELGYSSFVWKNGEKQTIIHYYGQIPGGRPRGTFIILPDYGESIKNYEVVFKELNARNFSVVGLDWPGQADRENYRKNCDRSKYFSCKKDKEVLKTFLKTVIYPDHNAPFYVLAHGMGALIALAAQKELSNIIKSFIFVAPSFSYLGYKAKGKLHRYCNFMKKIGLGSFRSKGMAKRYYKAYKNEKRTPSLKPPSFSVLCELMNISEKISDPKFLSQCNHAILFFLADKDSCNDNDSIFLYTNFIKLSHNILITDAQHHFIQKNKEQNKQFWAGLDSYIQEDR